MGGKTPKGGTPPGQQKERRAGRGLSQLVPVLTSRGVESRDDVDLRVEGRGGAGTGAGYEVLPHRHHAVVALPKNVVAAVGIHVTRIDDVPRRTIGDAASNI